MPSTLPDGGPAPADGTLPQAAMAQVGAAPFGVYIHVPFCARRCGYCDFNTYTSAELGGGASQASYADTAALEVDLARKVLADADLPVQTVFFGGGTPTVLPAADLVRLLQRVADRFGLAADVEVTTEANPESVDRAALDTLREGGFTRISFGMQSAREHVLHVLDRQHSPGRVQQAVDDAKAAGFEHINVDLIYGTPGETDADWQASLDAAVATGADHVFRRNRRHGLESLPATSFNFAQHRAQVIAHLADFLIALLWFLSHRAIEDRLQLPGRAAGSRFA